MLMHHLAGAVFIVTPALSLWSIAKRDIRDMSRSKLTAKCQ
jgi:hypothetical protein